MTLNIQRVPECKATIWKAWVNIRIHYLVALVCSWLRMQKPNSHLCIAVAFSFSRHKYNEPVPISPLSLVGTHLCETPDWGNLIFYGLYSWVLCQSFPLTHWYILDSFIASSSSKQMQNSFHSVALRLWSLAQTSPICTLALVSSPVMSRGVVNIAKHNSKFSSPHSDYLHFFFFVFLFWDCHYATLDKLEFSL